MSTTRQFPTVEEYLSFLRNNFKEEFLPFACEWTHATLAGWADAEFEQLYRDYVQSTQIQIKPGENATELKGRPLERVARYFLEKGAVVTSIKEISEPCKWQVDGQGPLNITAVKSAWGEDISMRLGFQLYMEAKNHSEPTTSDEFSAHYRRMMEHDCRLGVFVSTSGYRIGSGLGIADSIRENYLMNRFHLLLAFSSLCEVVTEKKPPLAVLRDVLCFAANNSYANDAEVQELYSPKYCHDIAHAEFQRLFSDNIRSQ